MLAALALVFLVSMVTEGRIVSKCELKEQLEASQIQVIRSIGDKATADTLIATLVCNAEKTSGFNTSLIASIQIDRDNLRPPFQIPSGPKEEKPSAEEEDDEKLEEEHIIPVKPQHPPKGIHGGSVPEGKTVETLGEEEPFWTWRRTLSPEKTPAEMSGSGPEAMSEEDSSGDSSEEEGRNDIMGFNRLGIFQLSDRVACDPGQSASLNLCGLECGALLDDDISDDIACLKTLAGGSDKMLPVKECRSVLPSEYFSECS
ncbi:uncharacterized protein wu:fj19g03 isoform X2 [Puntigrus tetrazona]|nr:uncharacterized protein wu:fj19g03 isoform X2 [Puntigrus tetrazona]